MSNVNYRIKINTNSFTLLQSGHADDLKWAVPPYPWGMYSKTASRCLKQQRNPIDTMFSPMYAYL